MRPAARLAVLDRPARAHLPAVAARARRGPPTAADLDYHLSTLFPPVRPRGHLELRVIDAQPGDGWVVPTALVTALVEDPGRHPGRDGGGGAAMAGHAAARHGTATAGHVNGGQGEPAAVTPWLRAARCGLDDPGLARAAQECFAAADARPGPAWRPRRDPRAAVAASPTATCCAAAARPTTGWTKHGTACAGPVPVRPCCCPAPNRRSRHDRQRRPDPLTRAAARGRQRGAARGDRRRACWPHASAPGCSPTRWTTPTWSASTPR